MGEGLCDRMKEVRDREGPLIAVTRHVRLDRSNLTTIETYTTVQACITTQTRGAEQYIEFQRRLVFENNVSRPQTDHSSGSKPFPTTHFFENTVAHCVEMMSMMM